MKIYDKLTPSIQPKFKEIQFQTMDFEAVTDDLLKYKKMESAIWTYTEHVDREFRELNNSVNRKWLQHLICSVATYRMFFYRQYKDLFVSTFPLDIKFNTNFDLLGVYMFEKGLINQNAFPNSELPPQHNTYTVDYFENPIKENSLEFYTKTDNIKEFVNHVVVNNINFHTQRVLVFGFSFYICSFAAYCGSIKILKYLLLNDVEIDFRTIERAINGGHESIIDFLVSRGAIFNFQLHSAIVYHQNRVAKWLMDHYQCEQIQLPNFLIWNNLEMFLYFLLDRNVDVNQTKSFSNVSSLMIATQLNNIPLIKFLILHGANTSLVDRNGNTAIKYVTSDEAKEALTQQ